MKTAATNYRRKSHTDEEKKSQKDHERRLHRVYPASQKTAKEQVALSALSDAPAQKANYLRTPVELKTKPLSTIPRKDTRPRPQIKSKVQLKISVIWHPQRSRRGQNQ